MFLQKVCKFTLSPFDIGGTDHFFRDDEKRCYIKKILKVYFGIDIVRKILFKKPSYMIIIFIQFKFYFFIIILVYYHRYGVEFLHNFVFSCVPPLIKNFVFSIRFLHNFSCVPPLMMNFIFSTQFLTSLFPVLPH